MVNEGQGKSPLEKCCLTYTKLLGAKSVHLHEIMSLCKSWANQHVCIGEVACLCNACKIL